LLNYCGNGCRSLDIVELFELLEVRLLTSKSKYWHRIRVVGRILTS